MRPETFKNLNLEIIGIFPKPIGRSCFEIIEPDNISEAARKARLELHRALGFGEIYPRLQWQDQCDNWIPVSYSEALIIINDFIAQNTKALKTKKIDPSTRTRLVVSQYNGLPGLLSPWKKLTDIAIEAISCTGDGPRFVNLDPALGKTGWRFLPHHRGVRPISDYHCLIRQQK